VNISWQHWYPACSTTPWQIEGVTRALEARGHKDLIAAHNGTVVVNSYEGELKNKHKAAQEKVGLADIHLDTPPNKWIDYKPKAEMLVLDDIFPEGIQIPESRTVRRDGRDVRWRRPGSQSHALAYQRPNLGQ
jgi:hypothetical protein